MDKLIESPEKGAPLTFEEWMEKYYATVKAELYLDIEKVCSIMYDTYLNGILEAKPKGKAKDKKKKKKKKSSKKEKA